MRLFGLAMVALLGSVPAMALAESGVAAPTAPSAQAHIDFQITIQSVLTLDEATRGCQSLQSPDCRTLAHRMPGKRGEHRSFACDSHPDGAARTCTTSSP
jgi:hypothetical protein